MKISVLSFLFYALSNWAQESILLCEDMEKITQAHNSMRTQLSFFGNTELRKEAEIAAYLYVLFWQQQGAGNRFPSLQQIKLMPDSELDEFGENIGLFSTEYQNISYHVVDFGFGGGNGYRIIIDPQSGQLSSRLSSWDGDCTLLQDSPPFTDHLSSVQHYQFLNSFYFSKSKVSADNVCYQHY